MYLRAAHAECDILALRNFIKDNPLGLLITSLQSSNFPTIQCTHIPWVLDVTDDESTTELGSLRGHLARANPHTKALLEAIESKEGATLADEVSVIFNGPAHAYVTPKFYTETKPATGKVVPTWNYSAVQVYGRATIFGDAKAEATSSFLSRQINDLTEHAERDVMNHIGGDSNPEVWEVADAPAPYIDLLKRNIVGIEIRIERLEGKFKMSQEMGKADREGVIQGFAGLGTENAYGVAATVKERGEKKDAKASDA